MTLLDFGHAFKVQVDDLLSKLVETKNNKGKPKFIFRVAEPLVGNLR